MSQPSISRRQLLLGHRTEPYTGICPPGATIETLLEACTGCGQCAERCPTDIIRLNGGLPALDFMHGECTFCGECKEACPEPVFTSGSTDRFRHIASVGDGCLAKQNVACQSCGEVCPQQAIRFRPRIGGPFVPDLSADLCNGCGACLAVCPIAAISIAPRDMEMADA
jgi:ferredoxin-type protein NapF